VADDLSTNGLPRQGALAVGTAETLHRRDLVDARTDGFKLSLKLYHRSELRLSYQQSIAEAAARAGEGPHSCDLQSLPSFPEGCLFFGNEK
jgi:hypothetical protein